ncbi:MAG: hypothetical protein IJD58_11750 [Lachnospiraceae bacterium]|nr:hypothetical protein [Lachnospiraceae bacterium]
MATYINNNVKFHGFSKSPVSGDTTLGGAVNPSGHTITTSQVRSQDIPAFLNTFQGTETQARTWLSTNYAEPAHNDIAYYGGEFKAGFSTPKCLKYNANTTSWESFDLVNASTLKNADDQDVIAVHQNCSTVFVDGSNNAATNSNRWSLFVKRADGSILDHFVASTDKIAGGMPSLGYNALVLWNGAAIDEGELDANYVGNTFAGIVHLNKQYSTGDDTKFKVTCFEYIGEKLDKKVSDLTEAVFGGNTGSEDLSLAQKVANNTTAISTLNANASTPGSVAHSVAAGVSEAKSYTDTEVADAKSEAIADATGKINTLGEKSLAQTSTGSTQVTVTTAGTVASGLTSITVSTSDIASANELSQLKAKVEQHLTDAAGKLEINVVETLPTTGEAGKIYLVPNAESADKNIKDEYIWVNDAWELIGSTQIDLSAYATTESVTEAINTAKTEIQGTTDGLATRIGTLETAAPSYALKATSLAASDSDEDGLVTVTTTGTLESGLGLTVTTSGIATAQSVSTLSTLVGQNTTAASNAQAAADAAQDAADAAQATANQAVQAAANAQSAAGSAQSAADAAQADATQALEDAAAAQTDATQALADAATADGKAAAAATAAANAQTAAEGAQATADAKISSVTGGGAGVTVTTDSATKAVTIAVGAINTITETNASAETIVTANAVTGAIAAQASKDAAAYAAKSTETTASDALTNAATAQTTANEAKTAASAAQVTANEAVAAASVADGKAVAAQTKADEAYTLADAATTTEEATTIAAAEAAKVKAKIPTTYVKSVNGVSDEVKITGFSDYYEGGVFATIYPTIGTTNVQKKGNDIFLSTDGLWEFSDGPNLEQYLPETTSIINGILDDKTFVNLEKCTRWFRSIGGQRGKLTTFITDLPNLTDGGSMFYGETAFTTFRGNLGSLIDGELMFYLCNLDTDSIMYIADGIKDWGTSPTEVHTITIHVASTLTSDAIIAGYFAELAQKGWTVASNHNGVAAAASDTGTTNSAVYVIARPSDEAHATHTTKDGKFVAVEVAKSVIGPHQHLWSVYASEADAILDMELTAI